MSHTSFFSVCINFDQFLVPMLQASGTYAVLLAWVCMYVWMRLGLTTGDMNNGIPCHQLYNTMHTMGHQL